MDKQQRVNGLGASPGIAIGKAFVLPAWEWDIPEKNVDVTELTHEFERLYQGIKQSKSDIEGMKREMTGVLGVQDSMIFDAHLAILDDPEFMKEVQGIIQRQYKAAEVAVKEVVDQFVAMFDVIEDDYMKERKTDIRDVGNRLLQHLLGAPDITLPNNNAPFILVAKELSPSQLAHLNPDRVLGILTLVGGKNSHAAIMARSMGIPLVVSLEDNLVEPVQTGAELIIDGDKGIVYIQPEQQVLERYRELREQQHASRRQLLKHAATPARTRDGGLVTLEANISSMKELELAMRNGAEGVGLFRTEFLYMNRSGFPSEQEQFEVYRQVAERMGDRSLVIRTLDIGGDKLLDYHSFPEEDNPFLGYRAIRFSLDRQDIFKAQIKAIMRAAVFGSNVKMMFPMIASLEELRQARLVAEQAKAELQAAGIAFAADLPIGIMIELPAAVMMADVLAGHADFFSIGTNDLTQYVLAVDRMNDHIAHLYNPYHPAVIKMIELTVAAAKRKGIAVSICGELAGDPKALPLLLGLGVTRLSMSAQSLLHVKNRALTLHVGECGELSKHILQCQSGEDVMQLLENAESTSMVKE